MTSLVPLVAFHIDGQRFALSLANVERLIPAVEVTPIPGAPDSVWGAINISGHVVPVFNLRRRFHRQEREIRPSDQFLVARTSRRTVALAIDEAFGVVEHPGAGIVEGTSIVPGIEQVQGVAVLSDGLMLIQNLESFLSLEEAHSLDEAMSHAVSHGT